MFPSAMLHSAAGLILLATLGAPALPLQTDAHDGTPAGWILAGNQPQNYRTGVEAAGVAFLASRTDSATAGFGTLMQSIQADNYAGKRVRFRASVRSENLRGWAGIWMRVDKGTTSLALDNMQSRPIKGSTSWSDYAVVLDVPRDATSISFGTLVDSAGEVWIEHLTFEIVGDDVPTTASPFGQPNLPAAPVNLDFQH